jgi:hypothetical protein
VTSPPPAPGGRGLQPERTSLAWRRTALSVAVGSLVGLRVLPPHLGVLGYVASALGLLWSLDLAIISVRRYHGAVASVRATGSTPAPGSTPADPQASAPAHAPAGADIARTTATAVLVGLLALACVLVIATG